MPKWRNTFVAVNITVIVLAFIAGAHAQRPAEKDSKGVDYLRVNINPTDVPPAVNINPNGGIPRVNINPTNVPPMVNINPNGALPRVDVNQMPQVHVSPTGCQNQLNFQTGVGRSIPGPLVVTYLHLAQQTTVTLNEGNSSRSVNFSQTGPISTAIYLRSGQGLSFDSDVMYSGCRPD